jgi:hypothetical protein
MEAIKSAHVPAKRINVIDAGCINLVSSCFIIQSQNIYFQFWSVKIHKIREKGIF